MNRSRRIFGLNNAQLSQFESERHVLTQKGITGRWPITGRTNSDNSLRVMLGNYYARNRSICLEVHELASTARAVPTRKGTY